jgi:hypothetical protein
MEDLQVAERAYAAGLFDGEGHIGIAVAKNGRGELYHRLMIDITNTNVEIVHWLFERWDGVIHAPRYFAKEEWRTAHRWTVCDGRAMRFLEDVLPFLIIKKEQAELGIEFQKTKTRGGFGAPKPDLVYRDEVREKISNLNKGL